MASKDVISILNTLIETSKDGEKGFREAASLVHDPDLKNLLEDYSRQCGRSARELHECAVSNGGPVDDSGSAMGAAHREWMNFKSHVTPSSEKAVLQECERGEDRAKSVYENALKRDMPIAIRTVVQKQYSGTLEHHDRIRALRNKYAGIS